MNVKYLGIQYLELNTLQGSSVPGMLISYRHIIISFFCQINILTKTVASAVISQNPECLFQYEQKCWKQYGVSIILSAC